METPASRATSYIVGFIVSEPAFTFVQSILYLDYKELF